THYAKFASDKSLCAEMIAELQDTKKQSPVHLAYLGSLQAIWANHVFSPIAKLNTFREGKQHIEQAIKSEPDLVELRFIRLSVQQNAPAFLGYKSNIREDTQFIMDHRHQIKSARVRQNIESLLRLKVD